MTVRASWRMFVYNSSPVDTAMISGVYFINTPCGSFTASSTCALVQIPLLIGTNTITLFTPSPLHTLSSGVKMLHHQIQGRVKGIGPTHQHRSTYLSSFNTHSPSTSNCRCILHGIFQFHQGHYLL